MAHRMDDMEEGTALCGRPVSCPATAWLLPALSQFALLCRHRARRQCTLENALALDPFVLISFRCNAVHTRLRSPSLPAVQLSTLACQLLPVAVATPRLSHASQPACCSTPCACMHPVLRNACTMGPDAASPRRRTQCCCTLTMKGYAADAASLHSSAQRSPAGRLPQLPCALLTLCRPPLRLPGVRSAFVGSFARDPPGLASCVFAARGPGSAAPRRFASRQHHQRPSCAREARTPQCNKCATLSTLTS